MKHLKKFEAFSDYTDAIKNIGGKIGSKIGGILGNPSIPEENFFKTR